MKLRTMLSSLALVSAMGLSGGAFAQAMLGDMEIPADNLGLFQEKCAAIASAAAQSLAEPVDNADETATGSTTATDNDDPDLANKDNIEALLASMTPEQCEEAGLLPGGANAARAN
jgi:hypothetical protein